MFVNDEMNYDEYEEAQDGGFGLSLKRAVKAVAKPVRSVKKVVSNAPIIKPTLKLTKKVTSPVVKTVSRPFGGRAGQRMGSESYVETVPASDSTSMRRTRFGAEERAQPGSMGMRRTGAKMAEMKAMKGRIDALEIEKANGIVPVSAPVAQYTENGEMVYQEPTASQTVADSLSAGAATMPGMPNTNMPSLPGIMPQMRMPSMPGMQRFQGQMSRMGMSMPTMPTMKQLPAPASMDMQQYPEYQEPVAYQEQQEPQYYEQPQMVQEAEFEPVEMSDEEMYYDETGAEMPQEQEEKGFWDKVKDSLASSNNMSGLGAVELDDVTGEPVTSAAKSGGFADDYAKGADSLAKLVGQSKAIGSATRKVKRSISRDKSAPAPVSAPVEAKGGIPPALMYGAGAVGIAGLVFLLVKMRSARQAAA